MAQPQRFTQISLGEATECKPRTDVSDELRLSCHASSVRVTRHQRQDHWSYYENSTPDLRTYDLSSATLVA